MVMDSDEVNVLEIALGSASGCLQEVYGTSDFESAGGYTKQVEVVSGDRSSRRTRLGISERPVSMRIGVDEPPGQNSDDRPARMVKRPEI
jgi:hypothetical protein